MAKKKKPAGNPARGFATTSVASKPKPERPDNTPKDAVAPPPSKEDAATSAPAVPAPQKISEVKQEAAPTPEELEAQLEHDELQLLVEKHAPKVRREAQRHVTKFQTDRRVLRGQSHSLIVHEWLPSEIMDAIISLAQAESNDSNRRQGQQSLLKVLTEEDAMSKLWTLDLTLRELGFSHDHIQPVLKWVCANAASIEPSATTAVWALQESLEWLALDQCTGHSFSYEEPSIRPSAIDTPDTSRPATPTPEMAVNESILSGGDKLNVSKASTSRLPVHNIVTPAESDSSDVQVSDLESDIEADDLIPTYLKIKGKLYEIDPQLIEPASRKQSKGSSTKKLASLPKHTPGVRKLLSQLQQLTGDALFDEYEAETRWPAKRNQIAQAQAAKRQQEPVAHKPEETPDKTDRAATPLLKEKLTTTTTLSDPHGSEDEADLLGDMFTAIPDEPVVNPLSAENENVVLRDFGKTGGLSPRKVLDEAVRSRQASTYVDPQ